MTLELGRIRTCRFPAFSALLMALSASLRTEVLTMFAVGDSQIVFGFEVSAGNCTLAFMGLSMESALMLARGFFSSLLRRE
jgi:hypothetical protein